MLKVPVGLVLTQEALTKELRCVRPIWALSHYTRLLWVDIGTNHGLMQLTVRLLPRANLESVILKLRQTISYVCLNGPL